MALWRVELLSTFLGATLLLVGCAALEVDLAEDAGALRLPMIRDFPGDFFTGEVDLLTTFFAPFWLLFEAALLR